MITNGVLNLIDLLNSLMPHLTEEWRQELVKNRIVGVLFIDYKKAFDSICHKTMALKLQACGISGNVCII